MRQEGLLLKMNQIWNERQAQIEEITTLLNKQ